MSGRDFWESERSFDELVEQTRSGDPLVRWGAAFELGELGDERAAERLTLLTSDSDEFVREAARAALTKLDPQVLQALASDRVKSAAASARKLGRAGSHAEMPDYRAWKTRKLPQPDSAGLQLVEATVSEIVEVEGPVCGHRVLLLYGRCIAINESWKLKSGPVKKAIERLVEQGRICRSDDFTSKKPEEWILHRPDVAPVVVRQRGPREMRDIPINEVMQVLAGLSGGRSRGRDRSAAFETVVRFYGMEREMHKLAGLLTNEWATLLTEQ